jgi:hypothetical protein
MSQPTRAETQACSGALLDGLPPGDEPGGKPDDLRAADVSDPLVASALALLRATDLGPASRPGPP